METQTRSASAAVAQDIMLIPRVVYVPYAPQVPIAPARLAGVTGLTATTQTERREFRSDREESLRAAPRSVEDGSLDRLERLIRDMNARMDKLEAPRAAPVVPPAYCPPADQFPVLPMPQPCPPPSGVQPTGFAVPRAGQR